jgi:hypothetical protein
LDLNVLIRGQSNALLFADRGGAAALERGLEARLGGVDVHLLYQWGTDTSTIWSGSAFLDWDTDGQQASLLRYVDGLPADLKDNPTATVWMHNEYDQNNRGVTTEAWLNEVRADAALVRAAFGQDAGTTPYTFVPIRYPWGSDIGAITDGMAALDTDPSFNAEVSWAAQGLAMDGDGYPGSGHMGDGDAVRLGDELAAGMAESLRPLANGSAPAPAPAPEPEPEPEPAAPEPAPPPAPAPATPGAAAPAELSAGTGPDTLVLKISQDAYQGSAEYTVSVDGAPVGGIFTASAAHASGQSDTLTLRGDWGAGAHTVAVSFLNDLWQGSADTDRNLHVDGIAHNGAALGNGAAALMSAGTVEFAFGDGGGDGNDGPAPSTPDAPPAAPAPSDPPAAIDWNAIAAQVMANHAATGIWFT